MKPRVAFAPLVALVIAKFALHLLTNGQYGFHRDELATFDDARHLAWGFVAYPPLTPFAARMAMEALGADPAAMRVLPALAQCFVVLIAGLLTREFGGGARAQMLSALAVMASPVSMSASHLLQYVSFDLLWSVLTVYLVTRLVGSEDTRWWVAIGACVGLGLMTRYTIAWLVAGLLVGFVLTPERRLLRSVWFLAGTALAILIVLPNLTWQWNHNFVSLEFLQSIHARDVRIGRTDGFLWKQLLVPANVFAVPLWIAGLVFFLKMSRGRAYRVLGFGFLAALTLFALSRARDYYSAPLYPMLIAAGAVAAEGWKPRSWRLSWAGTAVGVCRATVLILPIGPINSGWFHRATAVNGDLREEIGWQDLVEDVAEIFDSLPAAERADTGILTGNYGEAGAINLYGPARGLPQALSRVNSYWLRGYLEPPPQRLVVVGLPEAFVREHFSSCEPKGSISNRFKVANDEATVHKFLWVCHGLREPWPIFWQKIKTWS